MAERRILILGEGFSHDPHYGKTIRGIVRYGPDPVVAILDSARAGEMHDGIPVVGSVNDALCFNPTVAIVGVATQGGRFPPAWRELLKSCIAKGLDVESGLHEFLSEDPELTELAARHGVQLRDLRKPPEGLSVPTGANLEHDAKVVLTVGSDCAIGKKTVAVELDLEARRRGLESVFVPTGQTGIAIAGWGIAVDAVVADFLAGAAERLVVEGVERGGKLLFVEGQGSLVHPMYSGVTLGLVHGSAPHVFVLCHVPGTTEIDGLLRATRFRRSPSSSSSTSGCRCPPGPRSSPASRSTRAASTRPRRAMRSRPRSRRRGSRRTTRCASEAGNSLTPS